MIAGMATNHPPVDRRARRKAETRAKLLEAAQAVFARQGIDATRINEITEEADVGFGSFYNHFESKDAVVAAVVEDAAGAIGVAIDAATADLDDPAEVISVAHRTLVRLAAEDPEFGWLLVRLEATHDLASSALGSYAIRDIRRGIASGRFDVDDPAPALAATGGALLGVVRLVLRGHAVDEAATTHAAGVLRLLGLSAKDADRVAARPLPAVTVAVGDG
jgi:AcrR family transcriptional regulator